MSMVEMTKDLPRSSDHLVAAVWAVALVATVGVGVAAQVLLGRVA